MKEKRYFCDWYNDVILNNKWFYITVVCLCIISCIITYNVCKVKYNQEVANTSESDYEYLIDVINNIYDKDGNSIILRNIPNDVTISNMDIDSEGIAFTCTLNKNFHYISNPYVFVSASSSSNKIDIIPISKDKATSPLILNITSVCFGLLLISLPLVIVLAILLIPYSISAIKKSRNS